MPSTLPWLTAVGVAAVFIVCMAVSQADAEEPPAEPAPPAMTEECEAWLVWLVDGHKVLAFLPGGVQINGAALNRIALACLDREPHWTGPRPPNPAGPPPPPEPATEPEPEELTV